LEFEMVFDRWHEVIQNWESLEVGGKGDLLSLADAVLLWATPIVLRQFVE
jgi:hypothetical protein